MEELEAVDLDRLNQDPDPEVGPLSYVMQGGRRLRPREYAPYIPTPEERRWLAVINQPEKRPSDPNAAISGGVGALLGGMGENTVLANPARIDRAKKIAATLDIPFSVAYDNEAGYSKALETNVPNFWKEAGKSSMRAIGSSYIGLGHGMEMLGYSKESADVYRDFGRQMQSAYATAITPREFTFKQLSNPAWWATTFVEGLTSSFSLVPAALVAGYGGMTAGAAVGLGTFGSTVLAALGATAVSRPFESIMEASQTKEQMIRDGWDEDIADRQSEFVFQQNMRLGASDIAQTVLAFTPITKMMGQAASQVIAKRVAAGALKFGVLGASEAGEEIWQAGIQQAGAEGGSVIKKVLRMNPEMQEGGVIGALMGWGLGGMGSTYNALTSHVESKMSPQLRQQYEQAIIARKSTGVGDHTAKLGALDDIAQTPAGKQEITDAVTELKDIVEGRQPQVPDENLMDKAVDAYIKWQESQPDVVPEGDIESLVTDENLEAVASGEVSIDEVLGLEPEPEELVAQPEPLTTFNSDVVPEWAKTPQGRHEYEQMKAADAFMRSIPEPPAPEAASVNQNIPQPDGFALQLKDGTVVSDLWAKSHADLMEKAGVDPDSVAPTGDGYVINGQFVEKGQMDPGDIAKGLHDARNAAMDADAAKILARLKEMTPEEVKAYFDAETKQSGAKPGGRLVSEEAYEAAKKALKAKTSGLHAGIDPTALGNMITIGAYHIESGLRTFSAWSKQMLTEFGDVIKPYLKTIWDSSKTIADLKEKVREVEGATQPARAAKPQIRRATGQNVVAQMIREDDALYAAMKKAEQASRIAYRAGNADGIAQAKADIREIVVKAKVRAELLGFKKGYKVSERWTTKEMTKGFKEDVELRKESAKSMVDLIQESLPPHLRGQFLDSIADYVGKVSEKKESEILDRIERYQNRNLRKEIIEEIDEFKNYKGELDVKYQIKLDELLEDINTKNFSPRLWRRMQAFADWADENGMPSGIGAKMRANLERFEKTQASELTLEELTELRDTAKHLVRMGKLKRERKLAYNERERDKAIERVLSTTTNIDPEETGNDVADLARNVPLFTYLQQRSPLRVARRLDGWEWGENSKMMKDLSHKDTDAQAETRRRTTLAMQKLHEVAPDVDWTDEETNARIITNIYNMQGAEQQTLFLMNKHGWNEVPELNDQEKAAIEVLREATTEKVWDIKTLYEELRNKEFVVEPNYILPHKYKAEFHANPSDALLQSPHVTSRTYEGLAIERQKNVFREPREDVLGIFEQAVNEQEWFLGMSKELDNIRQVVSSHRYREAGGAAAVDYWLEHLDIVARRGWTAAASKSNQSPWAQALKFTRRNIAVGLLAFRPTTILLQPTAIFPAIAYLNTEYGPKAAAYAMGEFIKMWSIPGHFRETFDASKALQNRKAGEVSVEDLLAEARTGTYRDRFTRSGMGLIIAADVRTAAGVQQGIENYLVKELGVPREDAHFEAETVMQLVSASSDVTLRPHMFARGELARTILTFNSFISNMWDILADDIVRRGLIQGDVRKKLAALVGIGLFVMAKQAEDEVRKFYYSLIGKGERAQRKIPFIVEAVFGMLSNFPVFGSAFSLFTSRGGSADIPLTKLIDDVFKGPTTLLTSNEKTKDETIQRAILRSAKAAAILGAGQFGPGMGPGFDVLEGFLIPDKDSAKSTGRIKQR